MAGSWISVRLNWHPRSNIGAGWYHGQGRYEGDGIIYDGIDRMSNFRISNFITCLTSSFLAKWARIFIVPSTWGFIFLGLVSLMAR